MTVKGIYILLLLLLLAVLLVGVVEGSIVHHHRHKHQVNDVPETEEEIEKEQKLLIECQNDDYRTYIKCLKREKRQRQHDNDDLGRKARFNCLNECFEKDCNTSDCIVDCHRNCRTRLTYTKTVETTYDCNTPDCNKHPSAVVPNITTNIHIQNILPNVTNCSTITPPTTPPTGPTTTKNSTCKEGQGGGKCSSGGVEKDCKGGGNCDGSGGNKCCSGTGATGSNCCNGSACNVTGSTQPISPPADTVLPKIEIRNEIHNTLGSSNQDCPCPGCNCYPYINPWQSIPQITIGIGGGGPVGGCIFPSWPCYQKFPMQQQQPQQPLIDCSICYVPMFQYRCDPSCFPDPRRNNTVTTTTQRPVSAWNSRNSNVRN